jgi:glycosyltransferase involved in cell wall biosynthesis
LGRIERSGMEIMLEYSAEIWHEFGWRIEILSLSDESEYQKTLSKLGYKVHNLPNPWSIKGIYQMYKTFHQIQPCIIHNHVERRHGITSLIASTSNSQSGLVRTVHNCFPKNEGRALNRWIQNWIEKLVGFIIVVPSIDVHLNEKDLWNRNSLIIENWTRQYPAGVEKIEKSNSKSMVILGNCSPIKRHELAFKLVQEFSRLKDSKFDITVHHVGNSDGASEEEIEFLGFVSQNYTCVEHGIVKEPQNLLQTADCLIVTSSREGQSISMLEALSMGVPCIGIKVPGLIWAENNPLVFLSEGEADFIETLNRLFNSQENKDFASKSSDIALRFSPRRGVKEYTFLYDRLIS